MGRSGDVLLGGREGSGAQDTAFLLGKSWHLAEELGLCFTVPEERTNSISQNNDDDDN